MKALVPILSKKEWQPGFVNKVLEKADELVLLSVIDSSELSGKFGFAATEIMQANRIMEGIEAELKKLNVKVESLVEWGSTLQKIDHIARLKKCDFVFLQKQAGKGFEELLHGLRKAIEKRAAVEVV